MAAKKVMERTRRVRRGASRRGILEALERRLLLATDNLLHINPGYPNAFYNTTGSTSYSASTGILSVQAKPQFMMFSSSQAFPSFFSDIQLPPNNSIPRELRIGITLDNTGAVVGGVPGPDFIMTGRVTDPQTNITYNGTLLQGEISEFGWLDSGTTTDDYDFRFTLDPGNPGLLVTVGGFFAGSDIGVTLRSIASNFVGLFTQDFSGGANGNVGPIEPPPQAQPSSLSGSVFHDYNNDGDMNGADFGINGVTLMLTGTDHLGNPVSETTTTNAAGMYLFDQLQPSDSDGYTIMETQPSAYLDGKDTVGTLGGNASVNDKFSAIIVPAGVAGVSYDFAEILPASVSGYVYHDANNNGLRDDGAASGIANASVKLMGTDDLGNAINIDVSTNASGFYEFTQLRPSDSNGYMIIETQPAGYLDGIDTAGSGVTFISQSNDKFTVGVNVNNQGTEYNFGEVLPASVGDFVWHDLNANGIQDSGEPGLSGVTVTLLDGSGNQVGSSTTTNGSGFYSFTGLNPGTYRVKFVNPGGGFLFSPRDVGANDAIDSDANTTTGETANFTLAQNQNDTRWDAGLYMKASVGDFVWHDLNANGIQDAGEPGLSGVTVKLYTSANVLKGTTTTNTNGIYGFSNLDLGSYYVLFVLPSGSYFSPKDQGADDTIDSDANTSSGKTDVFVLSSGSDLTRDAGIYRNASLSGFVFCDLDNDGLKETGDLPISGVVIKLFNGNGGLVAQTTTNTSGQYSFTKLKPGVYTIQEIQPAGYQDGNEMQGTPGTGTTGNDVFQNIILNSGVDGANNNFGEFKFSTLSGIVYLDSNNNGVLDSTESTIGTDADGNPIQITLTGTDDLGPVSIVTYTNAAGQYSFSNLRFGDYTITQSQPNNFVNGKDTLGKVNGVTSGSNPDLYDNKLRLTLPFCSTAIGYNFGEIFQTTLVRQDTATIGFWRNKNGQALLKKLNGSATAKNLGNWLASNFPKLWGSSAGSSFNLSGKTNTQVADFFLVLFGTSNAPNPPKTEAQALAVAFAIYVTNSKLSGGTYAASYGFKVTTSGIAGKTFNVGTRGASFGVSNNSTLTIMQSLQKINAYATNGIIHATNQSLRSGANDIFSTINEVGDIF